MVRFKLYLDKDEEQDWLQKMCNEGWGFKKFCLGFYTFEPCEPGEYSYQIDLLDNWSGDKKDYAQFMADTGVEVIGQWYRWVYLRKQACEGAFEMYTDVESKINQYRRIGRFMRIGLVVETICFLMELNVAIRLKSPSIYLLTALIGLVSLGFLKIVWKCKWKIQQLESEK